MQQMLELTLADGNELDIPTGSVIMFEEMREDTNPNFPTARSFIRYGMGNDLKNALLTTKVEDLLFELGINAVPNGWLKLTLKDSGLRLVVQAKNIVGRLSIAEGCEISLAIGDRMDTLVVNESRRQIKKWSEREPEGLIELPVPTEAGE